MFSFRKVIREDIFPIMHWRNEQMEILRQKHILTPEIQTVYFEEKVFPEYGKKQPDKLLFSILDNGVLIGYCGVVHINWEVESAEISFLLKPELNADTKFFQLVFAEFLSFIKPVAFAELRLNKLYTTAHDIRPYLYEVLEKNDFIFEARILQSVKIGNILYDEVKHCFFRKQFNNSKEPFNILITSISAKVPLIAAVKHASGKFDFPIRIYGTDMDDRAIGKYFVDVFWKIKPTNELKIEDVLGYCLANNIRLIIPTRDGELAFWAGCKDQLAKKGVSVLISGIDTINTCLDKLEFFNFCLHNNIPCISTFTEPNDQFASWVIKERYGAGTVNAIIGVSGKEAQLQKRKLNDPLFQPQESGIEYSVDSYVDRKGNCKGIVVRERSVVVNGESQVTTIINNEQQEIAFEQIILKLGIQGPSVLQAFVKDGNIKVIECNPRFGGASTLGVSSGLDIFYWAILEAMGHSLDDQQFTRNRSITKQVRYAKDLTL